MNNIYPIMADDVHAAIDRVFEGKIMPDDGNLLRAFMHHLDALEKEATLATPDGRDRRAFSVPTAEAGVAPRTDRVP